MRSLRARRLPLAGGLVLWAAICVTDTRLWAGEQVTERRDFSAFLEFHLTDPNSCGGAAPFQVDSASIVRDEATGAATFSVTVLIPTSDAEPGCRRGRCLEPRALPDRQLLAEEIIAVKEAFSDVEFRMTIDEWCHAADLCGARAVQWDDFEGSLHVCFSPSLTDASARVLLDLLETLRRGSEDCDRNGIADAFDIAEGRSRDENSDGIPDECRASVFHRGDPNSDGRLDISDAVFVLDFLFLGGRVPGCVESADANNDARVNITDAVLLLGFLFQGAGGPAPPGGPNVPCGSDPDPIGGPGDLGCASYESC